MLLIVGGLLSPVYLWTTSELVRNVLYCGAGLTATVAIATVAARRSPGARLGWLLLTAGVGLWFLSDVAWFALDAGPSQHTPFPSVVDATYLGAYPLVIGGLLAGLRGQRASAYLDLVTIGVGLSLPVAVFAIPGLDRTSPAGIVAAAYPVAAVVLLATVICWFLNGGLPGMPRLLAGAGLVAWVAGDVLYSHDALSDGYATGALDLVWIAAYLLWAAAALHPSARAPSPARPVPPVRRTQVMLVAGLAGPVSIAAAHQYRHDRMVFAMWMTALLVTLVAFQVRNLVVALHQQASTDALTGLPSRTALVERIAGLLDQPGGRVTVVFLDIDGFKTVNDALGHDVGDRLLIEVAQRLGGAVRPDDTLARFGGDEFVVVCPGADDEDTARSIGERLLDALSAPLDLGDAGNVQVRASAGVAVFTEAVDASTLLRAADTAMYAAKAKGKNRVEVYVREHGDRASARFRLEKELRRAIDRDEFRLAWQPEVTLSTGHLFGVEALVRWQHPERGLVGPDEFIPFAEESDLAVAVGDWVLDAACRQVRSWQLAASGVVPVAVNVSGQHLATLPSSLDRALSVWGVEPSRLILELTEHALELDERDALAALRWAHDAGCLIALDDFGTGWSSLNRLHNYPIDLLKIDRSFVARADRPGRSRALVTGVVRMAQALGVTTVAEGVETASQLEALREIGCDIVQGHLIARPTFPEDLPGPPTLDDPWLPGGAVPPHPATAQLPLPG